MISNYRGEYFRVQLEHSCEKILDEAQLAHNNGLKLILDGVPAKTISNTILKYITLATLNEQQIGDLTRTNVDSLETAKTAALKLYGKGIDTIVITMGTKGVLVFDDEVFTFVDSLSSLNFDATTLGNVFNAVLALTLNGQSHLVNAVKSAYHTTVNIVLFLN